MFFSNSTRQRVREWLRKFNFTPSQQKIKRVLRTTVTVHVRNKIATTSHLKDRKVIPGQRSYNFL